MKSQVRIAFVGAGNLAQAAHLPGLKRVHSCQIVAISDVRAELTRRVAARFEIPAVYSSPLEMIRSESVDAIFTAIPFQFHQLVLQPLFEAGLPMFCEKALAINLNVGEELVAARRRSKVPWLMVGYHKRSDLAMQFVRNKIAEFNRSGVYGPLRYVRLQFANGNWSEHGLDEVVRTEEAPPDQRLDGDGSFRIWACPQSCHQVNLPAFITGEKWDVTYASDNGHLLVGKSQSGVDITIEAMYHTSAEEWQERIHIAFAHASIDVELPAPLAKNRAGRVRVFRDSRGDLPSDILEPKLPALDAMRCQAENFVRAVRGEIDPLCTDEEALEDIRIMEAYHRARAAGPACCVPASA